MTKRLLLELESKQGAQTTAFEVEEVLCAGYAGRNQERVMEHIRELEKIGVKPPPSLPVIYSVTSHQAVTDLAVTVHGDRTSGEVEFVLIMDGERILVTVGSDHTDRELEKADIQKSKEVCPKPLAPRVWDYGEVAGHWDSLVLRSWVTDSAGRRLYQEHDLTALLRVDDLLAAVVKATAGGKANADDATTVTGETVDHAKESLKGRLIFSGTVPTREGFIFGRKFEMELHDPVLGPGPRPWRRETGSNPEKNGGKRIGWEVCEVASRGGLHPDPGPGSCGRMRGKSPGGRQEGGRA